MGTYVQLSKKQSDFVGMVNGAKAKSSKLLFYFGSSN